MKHCACGSSLVTLSGARAVCADCKRQRDRRRKRRSAHRPLQCACGRAIKHQVGPGRPRVHCHACSVSQRSVPDLPAAAIDALLTRLKVLRKWGVTDARRTA